MTIETNVPRVINLTPTWSAITPGLLQAFLDTKSLQAREEIRDTFMHMAAVADKYVEAQKKC